MTVSARRLIAISEDYTAFDGISIVAETEAKLLEALEDFVLEIDQQWLVKTSGKAKHKVVTVKGRNHPQIVIGHG